MKICQPIVAAIVLLTTLVSAECPNGCSGNGDCMAKDMCNCYKNFQGNDCSERTCLFSYAHIDTPNGDINMDQNRRTPGWILANSQQHPAQTYEYFQPDAKQNEAHFYSECSNKGLCDRSTGDCACFDGYEGNGCQRMTCVNKCSGHGTCESLRELGAKAGGSLFGKGLATGPAVYDLWDGNLTYGCRCDPWFHGPDCGKRNCKVGVDPLYLSVGVARYETFHLHAFVPAASVITNGWVRLRIFDYHGESYITKKITILDDVVVGNPALNVAAVKAALEGIPNLTIKSIKCESMGVGPDLTGYKSGRTTGTVGMSIVCQFTDNPGFLRLPEVVSYNFDGIAAADQTVITTTSEQQGENVEWFTTQSSYVVDTLDVAGTLITLTATSADPSTVITGPALMKIGPHIVLADSSTATNITLAYPLLHALSTNDKTIVLPHSLTGTTAFTITVGDALSAAIAVGSKKMEFAAAPTLLAAGDLIFYYNQFFTIQKIDQVETAAGPPIVYTWYAILDKAFAGSTIDGTAGAAATTPYKVVLPTDQSNFFPYVSECSGRGLCGTDTGVCTCFKGYTNENCNTQNILAL